MLRGKIHRTAGRRTLFRVTAAAVVAGVTATAITSPASAVDDPAASQPEMNNGYVLFRGGNAEPPLNGITYHTFRIPAIVRTKAGTLLAFAEGREKSIQDWGNINLLYKRGAGNGENSSDWSGLMEAVGTGPDTWGNPTPVVDRDTGTIWLFMSWNAADKSQNGETDPATKIPTTKITEWGERKVFVMKSDNDGMSFTGINGSSSPTDMTEALLPKKKADGVTDWAWDAVGPGNGVQTSDGTLVVPAMHRNIYSTDHGATWHYQKLDEDTGEATIAELNDHTLYRNDRPTTASFALHKRRWVARGSITGGFSPFSADEKLFDPLNEASVLFYNNTEPDAPTRTLFLNSASTEVRTMMRVRISYDDARTWPISRPFSDADPVAGAGREGGYSSMAKTADNRIGALVESNSDISGPNGSGTFRHILFRKFNLSWILHGCTC